MKKVQLFIHRQYDAIKLTILVLLVMMSVFTILSQIAQNDHDARERSAAVAEVANNVKAESEAQTIIINRQFRAICILIIETSGQEGLDKLDPESKKRCENLTEEPTPLEPTQATPESQPRGNTASPSSSPNHTPTDNSKQSDNSQDAPPEEPEEPTGLRKLPLIDSVLKFFGL